MEHILGAVVVQHDSSFDERSITRASGSYLRINYLPRNPLRRVLEAASICASSSPASTATLIVSRVLIKSLAFATSTLGFYRYCLV